MNKVSSQIAVLLALVISTTGAFAQTEKAMDQSQQVNEGLAKAAAKQKTPKKAATKKSAASTPASQPAPAATLTPAPAVNPQGSAVTAEIAPAAGSTTAAAPTAAPTALSKLSLGLVFEGGSTQNSWRDNGSAGKIDSTNAITGTYKLNDSQKVSLRHYFTWSRNEIETGKANRVDNNTVPSLSFARFHQATAGILGSEKTELILWASLPTNDAEIARDAGATVLRADYNPTWNITPKFSVTYLMSPRLNLVDRNNVYKAYDAGSATFKDFHVRTSFRAIQGPSFGYTINDKNSMYLATYLDQEFDYNNSLNYTKSKAMKSRSPLEVVDKENTIARSWFNMELGYEFTQKLSSRSTLVINPYLGKTEMPLNEKLQTADTRAFDADDLTYNLLLSLSL